MRDMHVVVMGGGPVGLLCAIEARKHFSTVTIVEKRSSYSRLNVPVVDPDVREHLKGLDVHEKLGFGKSGQQGAAPFREIENALLTVAKSKGIRIFRPYVVTQVDGASPKQGDRYKDIALYIQQWDDKAKKVAANGKGFLIVADLLVVASGGGAAAEALITEQLGFSFEKLKAKNYGAYGIFDEVGHGDELSDVGNQARFRAKGVTYELISPKSIAFGLADFNYLLANLSGITKADFARLKASQEMLERLLTAIKSAKREGFIEKIKEVEKSVALFKIKIQRAMQFFSEEYPAVIVGDAAVTPHPEQGSGYTTGFRGFEELKALFEALEKTNRNNDDGVIYQAFNDRYELHVSRKALEGTIAIVANNGQLVSNFSAELKRLLPEVTQMQFRKVLLEDIESAEAIATSLKLQQSAARAFLDYLKPDQGSQHPKLDWSANVGMLWKSIAITWTRLKKMSQDHDLVTRRLEELERLLAVK